MALLWSALSEQFLDKHLHEEYNNIKHGLRLRPSDWYFALGVEDIPGVPAPPEKMRMVSQSEYGASIISPRKLKKYQFSFERHRVNWWPGDFVKRMPLIIHAIDNILAFLKLANGVPPDDVHIFMISRDQVEEALRSDGPPPGWMLNLNTRIDVDLLPSLSTADILKNYHVVQDPNKEPDEDQ